MPTDPARRPGRGATGTRPALPRAALVSCSLAAAAALAGLQSASAAPPPASTTFSGSCTVKGTVTFEPAATNTSQPLHYRYSAVGSCDGTLDGRQVNGVAVSLAHSGPSYGGCQSAHTTSPGTGALTFSSGPVLGYTLSFTSQATEVLFSISGSRSGRAAGHGSFLTTRTSPDIFSECAGSGVRSAPLDMTLATESPLVSGGPSQDDAINSPATFSGSCQFHAAVTFTPPITDIPASGEDTAVGTGTCTGTATMANGEARQLNSSPAAYHARDTGNSSCEASDMAGGGLISLGDADIPFALNEIRAAPTAALRYRGRRIGNAAGEATLDPAQDPRAVASHCSGPGLAGVEVDLTVRTAPISG